MFRFAIPQATTAERHLDDAKILQRKDNGKLSLEDAIAVSTGEETSEVNSDTDEDEEDENEDEEDEIEDEEDEIEDEEDEIEDEEDESEDDDDTIVGMFMKGCTLNEQSPDGSSRHRD
ncbi:acidic leucine-rich nuclear phosphoprotein 32 family member B-like [Anoplophora glabripennis]|uniref:acidic leucine-rich nuclear phosphoprotein 32 family member B-like n=1 Tax=Anoplophora glabripennis TaxID=217634 RepID=UPI000C779E3B|nr:acidic leucine-rich nuclear phosphoprotein 32 family member B-like [Anoplophora glabripennis]